jgi:molybdopterin molybdotransferase
LISFDEAVDCVRAAASPVGIDVIGIADAAGRVLAGSVTAGIDSPRSDVSAMDGYAVRNADLTSHPIALQIIGESFAGAGWPGKVTTGTCARIFTGAPVPSGADRVVIQENVERTADVARIERDPGPSHHIRKRGGDFQLGDELLPKGRLLDPRAIVAAAGADVAELQVYKRPRVTILSTGDELAEPGTAAARPDSIPESVSFGIAALVEEWGGSVDGRFRLADDVAAMTRAAGDACATSDLVVVTGGASVGEKDFAKAMFEPHGLQLLFSKVAIKPGKPVWLGRVGDVRIIGLPGNPTSALVTARLLLAPLLCGMSGRPIDDALCWRAAPLAAELGTCGARETFHRARWSGGRVEILSNQDSSAQHALASAEMLVRQRRDSAAQPAGSMIDALSF